MNSVPPMVVRSDMHTRCIVKRLIWVPVCAGMMVMTGCAEMDIENSQQSSGQKPIENKVGKNGELISPDCKNWTASATTNYSNARQSNIGCAYVTNLGLMLEDPRDLERGASGGRITPDSERSTNVIRAYRSGGTASTEATTSTDVGQ